MEIISRLLNCCQKQVASDWHTRKDSQTNFVFVAKDPWTIFSSRLFLVHEHQFDGK